MIRILRDESYRRSRGILRFFADPHARLSGDHEIHLHKVAMCVRRSDHPGFDRFQNRLEALRFIARDQHGVKVSGTPELLPFVDPLTDHFSSTCVSAGISGRQVSRFTRVLGSSTSGKRRPLDLILAMAILASWRPTSVASTRTLVK